MKNYVYWIIFLTTICLGCVSATPSVEEPTQKITQKYFSINKSDGISAQEAFILAQNHLIFTGNDKQFDLLNPELISDTTDAWIYKFSPIIKTLSEKIHSAPIFIEIAKKDGEAQIVESY